MNNNEFRNGNAVYESGYKSIDEIEVINLQEWLDGYIAFSKGEVRLNQFTPSSFKGLLEIRNQTITGVEGYISEINLWRKLDDVWEELSIEREDSGFFFQCFLISEAPDNQGNCFFRKARTFRRENSIIDFSEENLESIEVIMPSNRLHFFITAGGESI